MLINGSHLAGCPVLSLHVGGAIAHVSDIIIDPNDLKIIGFQVSGPLVRGDVGDVLLADSIREFSRAGMIVDSIDEFVDGEEVIRIRDVLKLNFSLLDLKVVSESKTKLGKVTDYVVDSNHWSVHQIIVQRPFIKALLDPELIIARSEIIEVNDYQIIVKDEHSKFQQTTPSARSANPVSDFVNPFRKPDFAQDTIIQKKGDGSSSPKL